MLENIAIFDFQLDDDDMASIATLRTHNRLGPDPESYPFCKQ
jgi:diketogulonate reductase-like aldo/keto reductase